jgi:hypothetical protein
MVDEERRIEAIRNFVGVGGATSATDGFRKYTSLAGGWTDYADDDADLRDEICGQEEEEEEEDRNSIPNAPTLPPQPSPPKTKVTLRLLAKATPAPQAAPAPVLPKPPYDSRENRNLSSLLETVGLPDAGWDPSGAGYGGPSYAGGAGYDTGAGSGGGGGTGYGGGFAEGAGYGAGFAESAGYSGAGYGDEFSGAGAGASAPSGDSYKPMTLSEKFKWFDAYHGSLLEDPSDGNFRKLFGCRRGRTPDWRPDFTKWFVSRFESHLFAFLLCAQLILSTILTNFFTGAYRMASHFPLDLDFLLLLVLPRFQAIQSGQNWTLLPRITFLRRSSFAWTTLGPQFLWFKPQML